MLGPGNQLIVDFIQDYDQPSGCSDWIKFGKKAYLNAELGYDQNKNEKRDMIFTY